MPKKILHLIWTVLSHRLMLLVLLLVALVVGGFISWKYYQTQQELNKVTHQQQATQEQNKKIVDEVGKIFDLPTDEEPTIATITDTNALKGQPFFVKSANGDQVLIYTKAQRAILYRPSSNKIIDVTSINTQNTAPAASPTTDKTTPIKVALYNGSTVVGLSAKAASQLAASFPQTSIVSKTNASRTDYTQTQIIDISGSNGELAKQLATAFSGAVTTLPDGETKPNADILMILAQAP